MERQRYTQLSADELLARYQAGERHFIDISLRGKFCAPTLEEGVNLQGIAITDSILSRLRMDEANLSQANLKGNFFEDSYLNWVKMYDSILDGSVFSECVMCDAMLTGSSFENTSFRESPLDGAVAINTNFCRSTFHESTGMERVDFTNACLSEITAVGAILYGAVLVGVDLTGANIVNSDLRFADLTDAIFDEDTNDWHCLYCQTIMPDGSILNDHCSLTFHGDDVRRRALQQARSQET